MGSLKLWLLISLTRTTQRKRIITGTLRVSSANGGQKTIDLSFTVNAVTNTLTIGNPAGVIASAANSKTTASVTSNTSWRAASNQTWLTVSPGTGTNSGTLTFTATSANTGTSERTATVTVTTTAGTPVLTRDITVRQASTVSAGDNWEPNNTMATASAISSNSTVYANLHTSSDIDFYKFTVNNATNISIALSNIPNGCDFELELLNNVGVSLGMSRKANNTGEFILTRLNSLGTYYIRVWSYSGSSSNNYSLEISTVNGQRGYVAVYAGEQGKDGGLLPPKDNKEEDVKRFKDNMDQYFYNYTSFDSYFAMKSDILGYLPNSQATIVYWSGHTQFPDINSNLVNPISRASYYTDRNASSYVSYDAKPNVENPFNIPEYIGQSMQSSNTTNGYYSDSQWNEGLKWAIIAACNQLTYDIHNKKWARTLLGRKSRAHGILGYAESAPVGPGDFNVVDDFFRLSMVYDYSMLQAWIQANLNHSYTVNNEKKLDKAAVIVHRQYVDEKFSDMYQNSPGIASSRFEEPWIRRYVGKPTNWENIALSSFQIQAMIGSVTNSEFLMIDELGSLSDADYQNKDRLNGDIIIGEEMIDELASLGDTDYLIEDKLDGDIFIGEEMKNKLGSLGDINYLIEDKLDGDVFIGEETMTLIVQPINLNNTLSLTNEQVIESSLSFALTNRMITADALADWKFSVYELIEENIDVLEIGIDTQPTVVGYYVIAFSPNDEKTHEYIEEDGIKVLSIKNCFTAIIDGDGVCSVTTRLN